MQADTPKERLFIDLLEAAKVLLVSPDTMRRWIRAGVVPSTKIGRKYLIPREALTKLARDAAQPGISKPGPATAKTAARKKKR